MNCYNKMNSSSNFGAPNKPYASSDSSLFINVILIIVIIVIVLIIIYYLCKQFMSVNGIFFVHRDGCPYSNNMYQLLKYNGFMLNGQKVQIISLNNELARKNNVSATPTILNIVNGKVINKIVGLKPLAEIEAELANEGDNNNCNNNSNNNSNSNNIIVLMSPTCPYCIRQVQELEENNIPHEKILTDSEEGKALMQEGNFPGVPVLMSDKEDLSNAQIGFQTAGEILASGIFKNLIDNTISGFES